MPDNELMDVVSEDDDSIGKKPRSIIHSTGLRHRGVHIFLFNKKGSLLLEKRSKEKDVCPGFYDCISEHLMFGEGYREAVKRCMTEELDIRNAELKRLLKIKWKYWKNDNMISELYECKWPGSVKIEKSEIDHIKFCTLNKIQEMLENGERFTPWFIEMLKWYTNKKPRFTIMD
jgi:isopentenyldiphosphate isomerase